MWFLLIISIINSAFDQKGIILQHRVEVAGLPINILDGVTIIGLIGVLLGTFFKRPSRSDRTHRLYGVILLLFALGACAGVFGWMRNGAPFYEFSSDFRNFTAFAIAILSGRYYFKKPESGRVFSYVHVLGGILSAGLILLFFVGTGADDTISTQVEAIRANQYVSNYAGLAAALLFFTVLDRKSRIFPLPLALAIMGFCFVGQFATLNRSDWLSATAAIVAVLFLLPKEGRLGKIVGFGVAVPLLVICLIIGTVIAADAMGRRDLGERLAQRVLTLLPGGRGEDSVTRFKAWDTRMPGIKRELELWSQSPLLGEGFGMSYVHKSEEAEGISFKHCVWTSSLATTGIFGFAAYMTAVVGMAVIGHRMVRDSVDKGSVLMGAIGFTSGVYCLVLGTATMCYNTQRQGLLVGLLCGVVIKAREMQLTTVREYAGYVDLESPDMQYADRFLDPAGGDGYESWGRLP